jgi:hypothetical protein
MGMGLTVSGKLWKIAQCCSFEEIGLKSIQYCLEMIHKFVEFSTTELRELVLEFFRCILFSRHFHKIVKIYLKTQQKCIFRTQ